MDIEYIKEKIYHLDNNSRKIQPGEYLSSEIISILRDGNTSDRAACFAPTKGATKSKKDVCLFRSEITCSKCGKEITKDVSRQRLLDYLRGTKQILCEDCESILNKEKRQKQEDLLKENEQRVKQIDINTENYIKNYLNPKEKWDSDIPHYERQKIIMGGYGLNNDMIARHIQNMSYKDFLQTPYWEAVSAYKKYRENRKCALCGSNKVLATHHNTYERHGMEHLYKVANEDLIVLCQDCHSKFHDKL